MTSFQGRAAVTVSVIVPVGAGEEMWRRPLGWDLPDGWQLIIAAAPGFQPPLTVGGVGGKPDHKARWLVCPRPGRAAQMNYGAACADGEWLWFVHADTSLSPDTCAKLRDAINDYPLTVATPDDATVTVKKPPPTPILYFDLRFVDGGVRMRVNEWGVRVRCALFGNPFGDQALCMTRGVFHLAGGFDEAAEYGEDHLLVLRARRRGVGVRRIRAVVGTSARRYVRDGWWRTVLLYRRLWVQQYRRER